MCDFFNDEELTKPEHTRILLTAIVIFASASVNIASCNILFRYPTNYLNVTTL